jgi:hypothetical protein
MVEADRRQLSWPCLVGPDRRSDVRSPLSRELDGIVLPEPTYRRRLSRAKSSKPLATNRTGMLRISIGAILPCS